MVIKLKLKMYALTTKEGELLLDPQANPLSSLSRTLLEKVAAREGGTVTEIESIEADAELGLGDASSLATRLAAYI